MSPSRSPDPQPILPSKLTRDLMDAGRGFLRVKNLGILDSLRQHKPRINHPKPAPKRRRAARQQATAMKQTTPETQPESGLACILCGATPVRRNSCAAELRWFVRLRDGSSVNCKELPDGYAA